MLRCVADCAGCNGTTTTVGSIGRRVAVADFAEGVAVDGYVERIPQDDKQPLLVFERTQVIDISIYSGELFLSIFRGLASAQRCFRRLLWRLPAGVVPEHVIRVLYLDLIFFSITILLCVYQEMAMLLERGSLCRTTGSTLMNAHSSRSHAIFTVLLEQRIRPESDASVPDEKVGAEIRSMRRVDLILYVFACRTLRGVPLHATTGSVLCAALASCSAVMVPRRVPFCCRRCGYISTRCPCTAMSYSMMWHGLVGCCFPLCCCVRVCGVAVDEHI